MGVTGLSEFRQLIQGKFLEDGPVHNSHFMMLARGTTTDVVSAPEEPAKHNK